MQNLIYEFRSYRLQPGKAPLYLSLLQRGGVAIVSRHLPLVGFWMTETGRLNTLHHLWAYESLEERASCRARLMADGEWTEGFIPEAFPLLQEQSGRLMRVLSGTAALEAAVGRRKQTVEAASAGAALFADTLHALTISRTPTRTPAGLAAFMTISGENPGSGVAIGSASDDLSGTPAADVMLHELMRPAVFSPLR